MKTSIAPLRLALLTAAFVIQHSSFVMAQGGSLTPPGAPGVLFKTLHEVEPRTPISVATSITVSGSYYLTGNIAVTTGSGITINANDVTLDLNGFIISSTASPISGFGVFIGTSRRNITIKNGHILGTTTFAAGTFTTGGFFDGININTTAGSNLLIQDITIRGMGDDGINLLDATIPSLVVERCIISICANTGIRAGVVRDCVVETAGANAIIADMVVNSIGVAVGAGGSGVTGTSVVENCRGTGVGSTGISGGVVSNSSGTSTSFHGIFGTTITNSTGTSTSQVGVATADGSVTNCYGTSTSGVGINSGGNVTNSHGISDSNIGIISAGNVTNSFGRSTSGSFGISISGTASFCRGFRNGGVAISAPIAIGCTVSGTGTVTSAQKHLGTP